MKPGFFVALLLSSLAPCVGRAADMAVPLQPVFPVFIPPIYDWTGFYIGVNGGGAFGQSRQSIVPLGTTTGNFDVTGGLVGGTVGYNLQIDRMVFGLEGDIDWARVRGSVSCRFGVFTCSTQSDYLGTVRARVGYTWPENVLFYVTGGAALADISQGFSPALGGNNGSDINNIGWTVGGGVQFAPWNLSINNWTVKIEYLYVNLGNFGCPTACSGLAGQTTNTTLYENVVRAGINYRF
jgi:outer membrane immunogenic protein